jgi:formylglycine-generating enzyme required for sulfatase activity
MRRGEWWDSLAESEKGKELLRLGGATLPVGSFRKTASPYGCYDMIGNAAEWVEDWLDKYPGNTHPPERLDSRLGQQCRVVRGGDWSSLHTECASRTAFSPRTHKTDTGFRCAKTP